ncbi:MAG: type VI secretion system-associated FHA domain protein TagH, partial [Pseudomonas sp.]
MELILDMISSQQSLTDMPPSKTFRKAGGIIGRAEDCDWVIPDRKRVVSGRHAEVSFQDGAFYLTDTSSNGILLKPNNTPIPKGQPHRIEHGTLFSVGDFEIRARLVSDPAVFSEDLGRPQAAGSIIPDDAFLDLDPLNALDQQEEMYAAGDELAMFGAPAAPEPMQSADYAPINTENLIVPELVAAEPEPAPEPQRPVLRPQQPPPPEHFWSAFGEALGVDLQDLSEEQRQSLALKAARLFKQSIGSLQQSLRNRNELKAEMKLPVTRVELASSNPLKSSTDSRQALAALLQPGGGAMPAEQAIHRAYRDLQAHQVALVYASRAAVKGIMDHLSPEQLTLRFERENKSLLNTSGSRWRAYTHLYQALQKDDNWSQGMFSRDFVMAYEEQIRLIATLN